MPLEKLTQIMLPAIEQELQEAVSRVKGPALDELLHMLAYHLGWEDEAAGSGASGKRIRPLLVLLTTAAAGGEWQRALPAAAAVELVHNFSLIHDDIQDNSPLRRGRPTLWKKWGIAQAVNAGDAMLTLAHLALLRLKETTSTDITLQAAHTIHKTCLHLTQGQYLDIAYELQGDLTIEAYWPMVEGKTSALLAACTELGALVASADGKTRSCYRRFGHFLGLAFQVQDDLLGIWGDTALTGKSAESDLVSGKKSLPVLHGLSQNGPFAKRWAKGPITVEEVATLSDHLVKEGSRSYTETTANNLNLDALKALDEAQPIDEAGEALRALVNHLLHRQI